MSSAHYQLREEPSPILRDALVDFDSLTQTLLFGRGIVTAKDAQIFFDRSYECGLHDPFLLPDMEVAVTRILGAIAQGEKIAIYSDYDCDGIPGGVLLHDFFKLIAYPHVQNYIPHRHHEGYGLNTVAIDSLQRDGVTLMITVDCGITDVDQVMHAQKIGIDAIVTDHHEPGPLLPPAIAVINPKRVDSAYPFSGLCGSGVAYKLVLALIARGNFSLTQGQEKWLLDMVGIATIADMVPLTDENRLFAHYGLLVMKKNRRLGLQHLFRTMKMQASSITEDDVGFMIAPRINAASRMDSPEDAFKLLTAATPGEAGMFAQHLDHINNERKGVVGSMVKEINKKVAELEQIGSVLVVGDPSWRPALVGLAANTLAESFARPVFIWGRDGRNILKGSCRSGGGVSVVDLMHEARESFLEYGGHHMSGGFSVHEDRIHTLSNALLQAHATLVGDETQAARATKPIVVDAELTLDHVGDALARTLARFAPFGVGNHKPLFLFRNVKPYQVTMFGKEKGHVKVIFKQGIRSITAIGFFKQADAYKAPLVADEFVDVIAHVEESFFGGRREVRLRLVEVSPAQG